jgi:hypothetical protein
MASDVPVINSGDPGTTSKSEIDILSEDDDTSVSEDDIVVPDKEEKSEEAETSTEETSTDEDEVEEESEVTSESEEEPESSTEEPTRLSWQTLKEKYPEAVKDKDLREMFFREKAFTEVFPTVNEAKEASQKAELLDTLDGTLAEGNIDQIFENLESKALERISGRILPALYKVNKDYFKLAARPLAIDMLHTVMAQADRDNDDNLRKSVRNVSKILTGNADLPKRESVVSDPSVEEERNKLRAERERLFKGDEQRFLNTTDRQVMKRIEAIVSDGIDPKKELTDFDRQAVVEKTINDVKRSLISDEGLTNKVRQLHRQAVRAGFPDEYRSRIVAASLDRARKLIPVLRNKHRTAALGKQSTESKISPKGKIVAKENTTVKTGPSRVTSVKQIDTRKTSAEDFLHDRVVLRK